MYLPDVSRKEKKIRWLLRRCSGRWKQSLPFTRWWTETHLFILSSSKRCREWKKICFCWNRNIDHGIWPHCKTWSSFEHSKKTKLWAQPLGKEQTIYFSLCLSSEQVKKPFPMRGAQHDEQTKAKSLLIEYGWLYTELGTDLISAREEPQAVWCTADIGLQCAN